ncbi:MAG: hypothetical protein ACJ74Z_22065 [Bryobacteraceae bacterium]
MISYSVGQGTQEIGIRAALGAAPLELQKTILLQTLGLTPAGPVVGYGSVGHRDTGAEGIAIWRYPGRSGDVRSNVDCVDQCRGSGGIFACPACVENRPDDCSSDDLGDLRKF